jgi:hypothetical protein
MFELSYDDVLFEGQSRVSVILQLAQHITEQDSGPDDPHMAVNEALAAVNDGRAVIEETPTT